ncbi:MAG: hypothetical protein IPL63_17170 [Saprospiraceae bacterium]|nr:hypothetical protein [Saprospiraceae bacterium]MBK7524223.1 hypothetical protein [Saprospiraceae bacterium]MBK8549010.1 hypothetical protein [Saprospiraceae bacterium]MBK8855574.1 hypothetical protein [Saprospiraceae bacterium]MBK9043576.1 hypothetical protein [Saprospiraceae bacterium]
MQRIEERTGKKNVVACDHKPYYRHKREEFLKLLKAGEKLNFLFVLLRKISLPITSIPDKVFTSNKDVCRMEYSRE